MSLILISYEVFSCKEYFKKLKQQSIYKWHQRGLTVTKVAQCNLHVGVEVSYPKKIYIFLYIFLYHWLSSFVVEVEINYLGKFMFFFNSPGKREEIFRFYFVSSFDKDTKSFFKFSLVFILKFLCLPIKSEQMKPRKKGQNSREPGRNICVMKMWRRTSLSTCS